jgi:hypothetical protein
LNINKKTLTFVETNLKRFFKIQKMPIFYNPGIFFNPPMAADNTTNVPAMSSETNPPVNNNNNTNVKKTLQITKPP